jgi:UBX domain-containing protein 1
VLLLLPIRSGQEVLDPKEFMKRARDEMGAQTVGEHQDAQGPPPSSAFTGAGQTLSGSSVDGGAAPKPPQEHTITFYADGFTVDDGPLRQANDPANAGFLAAINQGMLPPELMNEDGSDADVHMVDKSQEKYKPPPVTLKPFGGEGRSMREEASSSGAGSSSAATADEPQELVVDAAAPTTTLQVRLADGSRKIVKANHTHTVLQLKQHIATFSPGVAFSLRGGFPPKPLEDLSLSLADAKLLNETIVQSTL